MFVGSIVLIALAGVAGIIMLGRIYKDRPVPMSLAVLHGLLAAGGVVLAFAVAFQAGAYPLLCYALGAFVLAALGGLFLFSFHLRRKRFPTPLVFLHGIIGATGLILLIIYAVT